MAVAKNTPLLPTVTVSLAGLEVIDGGEFVGGGLGEGGGVGSAGDLGAEDVSIFAPLTIPEQPAMKNAEIVRSVCRSRLVAQTGREFGSRGTGCLVTYYLIS